MRGHTKPAWALGDADRARLRALLEAVPEDASEDSPEFIRLLEAWASVGAPYDLVPAVCCYRCQGGEWVTAGVGPVLAAISRHVNT